MGLGRLYIIARRIHRLSVIVMVVLALIMMQTGMVMRFAFVSRILPFLDPAKARFLHNTLSPYFALILSVMMVTGGYMFIHPHLVKRKLERKMEKERTF